MIEKVQMNHNKKLITISEREKVARQLSEKDQWAQKDLHFQQKIFEGALSLNRPGWNFDSLRYLARGARGAVDPAKPLFIRQSAV